MLNKRWTKVKPHKILFHERKQSSTSPDPKLKELCLTKQISRPRMDYEWIGKNYLQNNPLIKIKNGKNQSKISACEQKTTSEQANNCSNTIFSLYF